MRWTRGSIAVLMTLIAIVAINLAVLRAIRYNDTAHYQALPIWLICQLGLYRITRNRGRARAFWSGFGGACVVMSLAHLADFLACIYLEDAWNDRSIELSNSYWGYFEGCFPSYVGHIDKNLWIYWTLIWTLPQLLLAVAIGMVVWWLHRRSLTLLPPLTNRVRLTSVSRRLRETRDRKRPDRMTFTAYPIWHLSVRKGG